MSKDKEYNEEEIIVGEYMEVSENGKEIVKENMEKEDKEVFVDEAVAAKAWKPLDRMLELGR